MAKGLHRGVLLCCWIVAGCDPDAGLDAGADGGSGEVGADAPADVRMDGGADAHLEDVSSSDAGRNDPAIESLCASLSSSMCAAKIACFGELQEVERAACELEAAERCRVQLYGRAHGNVDPARAAACVARASAAYERCVQPGVAVSAECSLVWLSDITLGSACEGDGACAAGTGVCIEGTCVSLPRDGEECSDACVLPARCGSGHCELPAALGDTCITDAGCENAARCSSGQCAARGGDGAPCSDHDACAGPLRCLDGSCAPSPDQCASNDECSAGASCVGTSSDAVCVDISFACGSDAPCRGERYCADGRCRPFVAVGAACSSDVACGPVAWCDLALATPVCVPYRLHGESCTAADRCEGVTYCLAGSCDAPGPPDCTIPSLHCPEGQYCSGPDFESQRCHAYLPGDSSPCSQFPEDGMLCETGFHCELIDEATSTQRCVADRMPGQPCWEEYCYSGGCLFPTCAAGAFCDDAHVCRASASIGDECAEGTCVPGAICAEGVADGRCDVLLSLDWL